MATGRAQSTSTPRSCLNLADPCRCHTRSGGRAPPAQSLTLIMLPAAPRARPRGGWRIALYRSSRGCASPVRFPMNQRRSVVQRAMRYGPCKPVLIHAMRYGPCKPVLTHTARAIRVVYRSCEFMSHLSHPLYVHTRPHPVTPGALRAAYARGLVISGTSSSPIQRPSRLVSGSGHIRQVVVVAVIGCVTSRLLRCRDVLRELLVPAFVHRLAEE